MMLSEIFYNAPFIWFLIGVGLVVLELVVPGLILIFFAFGAFVVSLIGLVVDISVSIQIVLFVAISVLTLISFRKKLESRFFQKKKDTVQFEDDEFVGQKVPVMKRISATNEGKVEFKGAIWTAKSNVDIEEGETVEIIGKESIKLIVKPIK